MTTFFENVDIIVAGNARTLANGDDEFVNQGVTLASTGSGSGLTGVGGSDILIYGAVLSADGTALDMSSGGNLIAIGAGGLVAGKFAITLDAGNNNIANDGTVSSRNGINISGTGDNSIVNTGHISTSFGDALFIAGGNNVISNSGTIASGNFEAIFLSSSDGDGANTIDNSGTIATGGGGEAIHGGAAPAIVTNTGHIFGRIVFGDADDTYDGALGSIAGSIDGAGGDDHLTGGAGNDLLIGGAGSDTLEGNGGRDHFIYRHVIESNGRAHDTILGFDADKDVFDLDVAVTGIDATVASGLLRTGQFANDLVAAVGPAHLGSHHAVRFTPTTGDLAGHVILVVDANGNAGYQKNKDYVFDLSDADNLGHLDTGDFI